MCFENRSVSYIITTEFVKDFEGEEKRKERVIKIRKNTPEERNRRRKEWRKRKQGKQMPNSTNKNVELKSFNREPNDLLPCTSEAKEKKPRPLDQFNALSQKMSRNPVSSRLNQVVERRKWTWGLLKSC